MTLLLWRSLKRTEPAALVVMLANGVVLPTMSLNLVTRSALTMRSKAPSRVLSNVKFALPTLNVTLEVKVMPCPSAPISTSEFCVLIAPARVIEEGAAATKPPANVRVSPAALPSFKAPVFKNSVAPVTLVVPNSSTL